MATLFAAMPILPSITTKTPSPNPSSPSNQRMSWRRNSSLSHGAAIKYDAGDNVKFGFPMAFTTTMLSWSILEFGGLMKGELQNAKQTISWATDYLLKATVHLDTIYIQVGKIMLGKTRRHGHSWDCFQC
ncbi:hypothetical protein IC575_005196 [Cucumis melo]